MPFDDPGVRRRPARNVLGGPLAACAADPVTGFYRNGCCDTGPDDVGLCAPRWQEAFTAGAAPDVILEACHEAALEHCTIDDLKAHTAKIG